MARKQSIGEKIADSIIYFVLALCALSALLPLINTVAVSFSNNAIASGGIVTFYPLGFTLQSYKTILKEPTFFNAFWISVQRVVLTTSISLLLTVLAAYPLSKEDHEFRARKIFMWIVIFTMMFGPSLIPWYLQMKNLGLRGNIWGLVIPGLVSNFNIILLVNFFRSLPKSMDECASIDGAGAWTKLFKIYLPLSVPVLATLTLFMVVGNWNDFFLGLVLMNRIDQYPLQTYIQQLVVTFNPSVTDPNRIHELLKVSDRTLTAAKIVVSAIPILAIYPFLQRYFVKGIMLGSIKE